MNVAVAPARVVVWGESYGAHSPPEQRITSAAGADRGYAAVMRGAPRKTTPRVKDGRVQRKNHRDERSLDDGPLEVVTEVPGLGYRHVLDEALLREFVALVPDWERVSRGLRTVTLCEGDEHREGHYFDGRIELSAWPDPPAQTVGPWHFANPRAVWERLGIGWRDAPELVAEIARDLKQRLEENLWDLFHYYVAHSRSLATPGWPQAAAMRPPARRPAVHRGSTPGRCDMTYRTVSSGQRFWASTTNLSTPG